jgi:hypothetical protein
MESGKTQGKRDLFPHGEDLRAWSTAQPVTKYKQMD